MVHHDLWKLSILSPSARAYSTWKRFSLAIVIIFVRWGKEQDFRIDRSPSSSFPSFFFLRRRKNIAFSVSVSYVIHHASHSQQFFFLFLTLSFFILVLRRCLKPGCNILCLSAFIRFQFKILFLSWFRSFKK